MVKSHRWHTTAIAAAVAALFGLCGTNAAALSLGRVTVQSSLGEPLRAEIEVPEINADEAASLKATVALPETFRTAGLDYNPAMSTLQLTLQKRADGRSFIRLSSDRAINDPFVDMIIEANWSTGRIVRDYTLLFDPPSLRQAAAPAPTPAQIPTQALENKSTMPGPSSQAAGKLAEPAKSSTKAPSRPAVAKAPAATENQVTIKAGDTASKIAAATKPANVSLDQMLVALLRANPEAFISGNVNRIKTGSVMNVPTTEQAEATPAPEATQIVVAQSKDFNNFRRKLAASAPSTPVASADRKASGSVQTQVEDKKATAATPDKLTLSKGVVKGQATEDQLAKERTAKEAASRAAEISKNITELSKLGAASNAVSAAPVASSTQPAAPGLLPITATTSLAPVASAPLHASSAPKLPASPAVATAPKPTASAVAKVAPVLPSQPSMLDELLENPLLPVGAGGLMALLAGFGFYRFRQRKNEKHLDSSFLESRLQPDSFFGASGGQSVDTNDNGANGTSMVYSPSQLDAIDDVDPVAEADVYMAYGRDLQAEEILKDALGSNPARLAIHQKLLEIYAKRNDAHNFEAIAAQAFELTAGQGQEWDRICELGLSIDPDNAFYQPGGQPNHPDGSPSQPASLDFPNSEPFNRDSIATQPNELYPPEADELDLDLDLDLDFSLDDQPASAATVAIATPPKAAEASPAPAPFDSNSLDFDFEMAPDVVPEVAPPRAPIEEEDTLNGIEFTLPDLDFDVVTQNPGLPEPVLDEDEFKQQAATSFGATGMAPLEDDEPKARSEPDLSLLDFDLGSLSLDLHETPTPASADAEAAQEDPLGTKLALAEEFRAIGDEDGARALIEEVISEATGDLKLKAQRALNNL